MRALGADEHEVPLGVLCGQMPEELPIELLLDVTRVTDAGSGNACQIWRLLRCVCVGIVVNASGDEGGTGIDVALFLKSPGESTKTWFTASISRASLGSRGTSTLENEYSSSR